MHNVIIIIIVVVVIRIRVYNGESNERGIIYYAVSCCCIKT